MDDLNLTLGEGSEVLPPQLTFLSQHASSEGDVVEFVEFVECPCVGVGVADPPKQYNQEKKNTILYIEQE